MKRGDIITVANSGDYGKPRPAVVIQSDFLAETDSVLVCLMTSTLRDAPLYRLTVEAKPETALRQTSQVMVDKVMAVRRSKCGPAIGRLGASDIKELDRMLALVAGIAD